MADADSPSSNSTVINVAFRWMLKDQLQFAFALPFKILRPALYGAALLGVGLAAYYLWSRGSVPNAVPIAVVLYLVFLPPALFILALFSNVLLHLRLSDEQKQLTYDIDEERLIATDATGSQATTPWAIVTRIHERRPGYLLILRPSQTRWIPKRILSESERAFLLSIAKRL